MRGAGYLELASFEGDFWPDEGRAIGKPEQGGSMLRKKLILARRWPCPV
jgi:hypothetical protein